MQANHWEFEGDLYAKGLGFTEPLRRDFSRHFRTIENGRQLRACLRAGDAVWPGGYAIGYYTADGAVLCPSCVRANLRAVLDSIRTKSNDGWLVTGTASENETDEVEFCAHCDAPFFNTEHTS